MLIHNNIRAGINIPQACQLPKERESLPLYLNSAFAGACWQVS